MGRMLASMVFVVALSACQTTTPTQTQNAQMKPAPTASCKAGYQSGIDALDAQIATLKSKTARGYQTTASPIGFKNPLKLCKGIGPIARACLPTPSLTTSTGNSSLPTYADYRQMKAEMKELEAEKATLVAKQKTCQS